MFRWLFEVIKGTIFHPQWLSDRYHQKSKTILKRIRNATVLDIGSGNASYGDNLHHSNRFFRLDYPTTNQAYLSRPDLYADATCLPIGDERLDVVLLFEVLEHVKEAEQVLAEISRVMRSDAEFYMSVPFIYPIHDAPDDYRRFTTYGVKRALAKSGLEIKEMTVHGNTLVTALQMINLGLLEMCRDIFRRVKLFGVLAGVLVYPITLMINLLALPLLFLPLGTAGNFGCFLRAEKMAATPDV